MSDTTHEVTEQLFDTDQTEVAEDATDTSENQEDSSDEIFDHNSETEQEQEGLDLKEKAPSKAEEKKLALIKATQEKIDRGELTLDKLPKAQGWMKRYLKSPESEPEVDHKAIAKELAKEAFAEERAELQFADLKDTLNTLSLSKEQRSVIQEKFGFFLSKGINRFEALALASEFAKVDFTGVTEKKRRMSVPHASTKKSAKNIDFDSVPFSELVGQVPQEKIDEYLIGLVKR